MTEEIDALSVSQPPEQRIRHFDMERIPDRWKLDPDNYIGDVRDYPEFQQLPPEDIDDTWELEEAPGNLTRTRPTTSAVCPPRPQRVPVADSREIRLSAAPQRSPFVERHLLGAGAQLLITQKSLS
jgi:hypothetical protein